MPKALNIIKDEHRSLGAVLHGLLYLVDELEAGRMQADYTLLGAMLRYIEEFPETLHHPKEDRYLHPHIRLRSAEGAALLEALEQEHVHTRDLNNALATTFAAYQQSGSDGFAAFAEAVRNYSEFHWAHMKREEEEVLPLAQKVLLPEDWAEIAAAFSENQDPIVADDARKEFRALFRKIANLAPPPIGVGSPPSG
jgi:hemerythrin-like domain-containing protein